MAITFRPVGAWNSNRDVVSFLADVDGKRIHCAISWEALQDNFQCDNRDPAECFRASRAAIEAKAERLILRARFVEDGSVLIRSQDGR